MTYEEKLEKAKEWLGSRWVFHPDRHITKGSYVQPPVQRIDVAETFKREFQRIGKSQIEVAR